MRPSLKRNQATWKHVIQTLGGWKMRERKMRERKMRELGKHIEKRKREKKMWEGNIHQPGKCCAIYQPMGECEPWHWKRHGDSIIDNER